MTEEILKTAFKIATEKEFAESENLEIDVKLSDEQKHKINMLYKTYLYCVNIPYPEIEK